jgi:transcriptional regulator with XRE-family HTH domain
MKLAAWLKERGMSTYAFAEITGIGQSSISRFALGRRIPKKEKMQLITRATAGAVTALDFYDTDPPRVEAAE